MIQEELRAPYPYFGGKRRVADVAWRALDPAVPNYVEPFAGSFAMLLGRPGGPGKIETANDRDRYVSNFYRAVVADPWAVAEWADYPVVEADMHARHRWLVDQAEFRERMHTDPKFFDPKIAGWWVWGICLWIGAGWCVEPENRKHPKLDGIGKGVHSQRGEREANWRKRPDLDGTSPGRGVHSDTADWRARAHLSGEMGVHRKLPFLAVKADGACAGRGVHSDAAVEAHGGLPSLGNDRGIHGVSTSPGSWLHALKQLEVPDAPPCFEWFKRIMLRLRRTRIANGDWKRVLGPSVLGKGKNVGGRRPCAVFLDPPYSHELRDPDLYSEDDAKISKLVWAWALENGDDPDLRIALCGYEGEHDMPKTWTKYAWKAARGYASEDNKNAELERIWFSPHCLPLEETNPRQQTLFGDRP